MRTILEHQHQQAELNQQAVELDKEEEESRAGCVYAFYDKTKPEFIKIGCSRNVDIRKKQASVWMPCIQVLGVTQELEDKFEGERAFHDVHEKYPTKKYFPDGSKEWFYIPQKSDRDTLKEHLETYVSD